MVAVDLRLPWVTAISGSRSDIDASSSTTLHSIYGSQVSQLPFTQSSDEDEWHYRSVSSPSLISRPKSAPANRLIQRVGSAKPRPTTAARRVSIIRTGKGGSDTQRRLRPTTATHIVTVGGDDFDKRRGEGVRRKLSRPSTAQPMRSYTRSRRINSAKVGNLSLNSNAQYMEEEEDEEIPIPLPSEAPPAARIKQKTVPVSLSSVPEYFNFWNEKPLRPREWDVPMHARKSRRRPKSDYGNRIIGANRKRRSSQQEGRADSETAGGLGTLYESHGDECADTGREGKEQKGRRTGDGLNGDKDTTAAGAAKDYDETENDNNGDDDDDEANRLSNVEKPGTDVTDDNENRSRKWNSGMQSDNDKEQSKDDKFRTVDNVTTDNDADEDDYFLKKGNDQKGNGKSNWIANGLTGGSSSSSTRFELPMDLKLLESMSPTEYLSKYCIINERHKLHFMKVFMKLKTGLYHIKNQPSSTITNKETIIEGIVNVHFNFISREEVEKILQIANVSYNQPIDFQLFGALCVLTERYYSSTLTYHHKEIIEVVDFEAIDWRLRDCSISTELRTLFKQL